MTSPRLSAVEALPKLPLGEMLLKRNLISQGDLDRALEQQSQGGHEKLLGEVLQQIGAVSEANVLEVIAEGYGVPFVDQVARIADPRSLDSLPRDFIEEHRILPLFLVRGTLTVAVSEPANLYLVEEIARISGFDIKIAAATRSDIESALQSYLPAANVFVIDDIYEDIDEQDFSIIERQVTEIADLEEVAGHGPVVKLVNYIIFTAVQERASDIHIEPDHHRLRVRYRVDGRLYEKLSPPYKMNAAIASRVKIMSNLDISERRIPQDGDFNVMLEGRPIDLRVSTMPGKHGETIVIRIIDSQNNRLSMDQLGFSGETLAAWQGVVEQPNGVVLVTGPTGSGKSTTLYSVLSLINSPEVNISTIEDPIEAKIPGINQAQVNKRAGFTFAGALRSMLRQDPDVLMVGEVRDGETAGIVTQAALTGHLVFSTLHTNDATSAVTRMGNLGLEPYLIAATLRGVLAQRLVRKICPHCKEPHVPEARIAEALQHSGCQWDTLFKGGGCGRCRHTGFAGRIGIFELLVPDPNILDAIASGVTLQDLRALVEGRGFRSLRQDGLEKVCNGLTTPEEVLSATSL